MQASTDFALVVITKRNVSTILITRFLTVLYNTNRSTRLRLIFIWYDLYPQHSSLRGSSLSSWGRENEGLQGKVSNHHCCKVDFCDSWSFLPYLDVLNDHTFQEVCHLYENTKRLSVLSHETEQIRLKCERWKNFACQRNEVDTTTTSYQRCPWRRDCDDIVLDIDIRLAHKCLSRFPGGYVVLIDFILVLSSIQNNSIRNTSQRRLISYLNWS